MIDINVNKCCLERRLFTVTVVGQSCSLYTIEVENKTVKKLPRLLSYLSLKFQK